MAFGDILPSLLGFNDRRALLNYLLTFTADELKELFFEADPHYYVQRDNNPPRPNYRVRMPEGYNDFSLPERWVLLEKRLERGISGYGAGAKLSELRSEWVEMWLERAYGKDT
jgi:hypothetical protein